MMYLLTAIGLPPGGSSAVYIYTQTIHRTTQNKQYIEQHKHLVESFCIGKVVILISTLMITENVLLRHFMYII